MVVPFRLVRNVADKDTVAALKQLLREAEAGRVVGLAYVALERRERFSADVVGRVRSYPILAFGITKILEETINRLFL